MFDSRCWIALGLLGLCATPAMAQSFRVQCPTSTVTHPDPNNNSTPVYTSTNGDPQYLGPTTLVPTGTGTIGTPAGGFLVPAAPWGGTNAAGQPNGSIKCQQISGGDGYMTTADGHQTFMFSFGPLSGLESIAFGNPDGAYDRETGASYPDIYNTLAPLQVVPGDPATTDGAADSGTAWTQGNGGTAPSFTWNGAVGLAYDNDCIAGNNAASAAGAQRHAPPRRWAAPISASTATSIRARSWTWG